MRECFFGVGFLLLILAGTSTLARTSHQPAVEILRRELGESPTATLLIPLQAEISSRIEAIFLAPLMVSHPEELSAHQRLAMAPPAKKIVRRKVAQAEDKVESTKSLLEETTKKYAQAHNISMDVKKELTLKILAKTNHFKGRFFLTGGDKLRLELDGLTKSVAILDGRRLWLIEYPQNSDDKIRVMKFALGEKSQNQILVTSVLGRGQLLKSFKIEKTDDQKQNMVYLLQPIKPMEDVKDLQVTVSKSDKLITNINYLDGIENKTTFEFSNVKFNDEMPKDLYKLVVPKGAEVTQM